LNLAPEVGRGRPLEADRFEAGGGRGFHTVEDTPPHCRRFDLGQEVS
jgi:hypothetical protein